jgi:hypothetical protein
VGALLLLVSSGSASATPSTYSTGWGGAKALYALVEDLGFEVRRIDIEQARQAQNGRGEQVDVLVRLGPLAGDDAEQALTWVRDGHAMIVGLPLAGGGGLCGDVELGSLTFRRNTAAAAVKEATQHPELKLRPTACALKVPAGAEALTGSGEAALAVQMRLGQGHVLVLAHSDLVVNANLNRDDLVVLIRQWLFDHAPARGTVAFVEERRGTAGGLLRLVQQANLSVFVLHGLAFLLLLYWALAPRSGDPRRGPRDTRREFSLHARTLGHLYQRRRASAHALRQQYVRFLDRVLGRTEPGGGVATGGGQPPERRQSRTALAALVATRTGRDPTEVESLLAQVEYSSATTEPAEARDVQRHYRLSQAIAALQQRSATKGGKTRGRSTHR